MLLPYDPDRYKSNLFLVYLLFWSEVLQHGRNSYRRMSCCNPNPIESVFRGWFPHLSLKHGLEMLESRLQQHLSAIYLRFLILLSNLLQADMNRYRFADV